MEEGERVSSTSEDLPLPFTVDSSICIKFFRSVDVVSSSLVVLLIHCCGIPGITMHALILGMIIAAAVLENIFEFLACSIDLNIRLKLRVSHQLVCTQRTTWRRH